MAKLPDLPSLAPPPGALPPGGGTIAAPGAAPLPLSGPVPTPMPSPLAAPLSAPSLAVEPFEIDLSAGVSSPAATAASPSPAAVARAEVDDTVEEMLAQSSEQTLQLVRMDEALSKVSETLEDFREEMHAGVTEMRTLFARGSSPAPDPALVARLDALEEHTRSDFGRLGSRIAVIIALQVVAAALAVFAVWSSGGRSSTSAPAEASPAAEISTMPKPESGRSYGEEDAAEQERLRANAKKKGKKRPSPR